MKVSNENKYNNNGQIDYMDMINDFQEEYENVYWVKLEDQIFIYRALGRLEYRQLIAADITEIEKEDVVCKACLLHPSDFDFDNCTAGIPTTLFKLILKNSFLDSIESKKLVVAYHRKEMEEFDNQITCIISEAFPNLDIDEIEAWDMSKTAKYLSRAEWKLNILRQVPVDYELSDKLMEVDWAKQHYKPEDYEGVEEEALEEEPPKAQEIKVEKQEPVRVDQEEYKKKVLGETLEERQARLERENKGFGKEKNPEEIARLKRAFPEINWDAQVNMHDMRVSTTPAALQTGI